MPLLVFAVLLTIVLHRHERAGREHGLRDTARALSLAVDRELQGHLAALEALATSVHLDRPDLEQFRRDAARVMTAQPGWSNVTVFDRGGRELAAVAPVRAEAEETRALVRAVALSGQASVSDVRVRPGDEAYVITVSVPVVRNGRIRYIIGADVPPVQISELLHAQQLDDWLGAIVDRRGHVLARSRAAERFMGRPAGPELMERLRAAPEGSFRGRTLDGVEGFMAYSRAPFTGWTVAIMVPPDELLPSARRTLSGLIGLGLVLGGVAVGLALLLGQRIATSMAELSATARALGRGEAPARVTSGIVEVNAVAAAMQEAAALLARRAEERGRAETALHERDERLRLALSAGQMVTWDWDLRTGSISWGDDEGIFRRDGRHDGTAASVLRFVHPDDRSLLQDTLSRAVKDGTACEAEFRVAAADGTRGWVAVRGRAFVDAAGAPVRMLGVAMDVTARKRAEEDAVALPRSCNRAMTRSSARRATDGSSRGTTAPSAPTATRPTRSWPVRRGALPAGAARDCPLSLARSAPASTSTRPMRSVFRKDGTRVDVSVTVSPIRDAAGRIIGASTIARDVTEQRRTDGGLPRSRRSRMPRCRTHRSTSSFASCCTDSARHWRPTVAASCSWPMMVRLVVRVSHGYRGRGLAFPVGTGVIGRIAAERRPA